MRQPQQGDDPVNNRPIPERSRLTVALVAWLLLCPTGSPVRVTDAQTVGPLDQATIFFSFAPWDGAAYDIEIPLEHVEGAAQPNIRINITGYAHDSTNH